MSATPPTLNGLRALSVWMFIPWRGAWIAEVDLDPEVVSTAPTSGPASLVVGGVTLKGTIDPRGSGSFVSSATARVIAGGGAWDTVLDPQSWGDDAGVSSTQVYTATATAIGETANDVTPSVLGLSYERVRGPAVAIFDGRDYFVDFTGITQVSSRTPATPDSTLEVLEWYPLEGRAVVSCDALIAPGTVLSDARFNGATPIVRDVDQTFTRAGGARATLYCAAGAASPLLSDLEAIARVAVRPAYLKCYRYRVVLQGGDGRVQLQAVQTSAGVPDTLPLSIWTGMQGVTAKVLLSSECLVSFIAGDPAQPKVEGWKSTDLPLEVTVDATATTHLGPSSAGVAIAGGGHALVLGDEFMVELGKIATAISGVGGSYVPSLPTLLLSAKGSTG